MNNEGGLVELALRVPDSAAVDDIRDPYLRALTADALDTAVDPNKLIDLEVQLKRLGCPKAAKAVGTKARQMRVSESAVAEEKKIVVDILGNKAVAEQVKRLVLP